MMPVGDIGARNRAEHGTQRIDGIVAHDFPDGLAHARLIGEVVQRGGGRGRADDHVEHGLVAVGEEDRSRLATERFDMLDAVAFLIFTRKLMALDDATFEFVDGAHADDAGLHVPLPGKAVDVIRQVAVLHEGPVLEALVQQLRSTRVYLWCVHVLISGKLRLESVDVQEGERPALDVLGRLAAVKDVIGKSCHLGGVLGDGANAREGKRSHGRSSRAGRSHMALSYPACATMDEKSGARA